MKEWTDSEKTRARNKALVLLADMDRTEAGLRDRLKRGGFSKAAIDDAVEYVRGYGYIDDVRYAEHYVEVMKDRKSLRRIAYEMSGKGVPKELIDKAMEESALIDERPLIRKLAEKKARSLDADDPKRTSKIIGYLMRQGFRGEDVRSVMSDYE